MRNLYLLLLILGVVGLRAQGDCPPVLPTPAGTHDLLLTPLSTYRTGVFDEGAAEIVAYDTVSQRLVFINADANAITILDISDPSNPTLVAEVTPEVPGVDGVNSVAIANGLIAAAFQGPEVDSPGKIVVMNGDGVVVATFDAGALPDMITFSPDGNLILTANEGEPNDAYTVDPEGSVTVVDITEGLESATATTIRFTDFNTQRASLMARGVRLFGPGASVAQDLEPEYITVQGDRAYVGLQENNAFAVLDLNSLRFTDIVPFGYKDYSCEANAFDASNRDDMIAILPYPVLGMYMPDAIASFSMHNQTYLVTANEGDARDYDGYSEETRVADLQLDPDAYPDAESLQDDGVLGRLTTTTANGDVDCDGDVDQIYSYGARSFSIFHADGTLIYDSGSEFERILAELLPDAFNSNNDENDSFDSRSDDKGPEPEAVELVVRGDRMYALIGLERIGGVMIYDITIPEAPFFVSYTNNRDFTVDAQLEDDSVNPAVGDLGVEDILFIPAASSPNDRDLVVTANEISGTVTLFSLEAPTFTLQLLHNNDGESQLVADTLENGLAFGGAARFTAIVDSLRNLDLPTLTLSSGDNFLPGPAFNASLARPAGSPLYDSEVLNAIDYDALVIGNHDFDFGPDILQRVIEETATSGPVFLSANLDFSAEPGLEALVTSGRIASRTTVEVAGERIGIVGLTTPALPTVSSPRGVTVDPNLVGIAQAEIDALQNGGVNKIVLISHLQSIDEELMLAGSLTGVDIIIAGGGDELLTNDPANALGGLEVDDTYPIDTLDADGNTVYVVTTPGEYRYVGNLIVEFDGDGNVMAIAERSDVIPVTGSAPVDAAVAMLEDSVVRYNASLASNIVAITEVDLNGLRADVRTMETNQGNLITDAYLWYFDTVFDDYDFDETIPVIAVQNGGGIRNDEVIPANSEISELKTFDILPFANFVSVIEPISPDSLKAALENSVSQVPGRDGRFLQIAGFEIVYDTTGTPNVDRITTVTLDDGTPIVANGEVVAGAPDVYVVTNNFTAGGGDAFGEFAALAFTNIGPSYQRVLYEYLLAETGANGIVTAADYPEGGTGRITIASTSALPPLDLGAYGWTVSPNPFRSDLTVGFELPAATDVGLHLYDNNGRLIAEITDGKLAAGSQQFAVPASDLPAGVYWLRVRMSDRVASQQVIRQ
ncbi:putative secreted protein (Por secretion system target) [Neolewinella xylanilytica]|uniref:Putative secreted protein (Por secretion system target) n=1 Tax=Neolewinella xylanilytica TaxID=1514080 RepID=A0A2S6I9K1_9BACT|nr:choice-of-anchor I family protein [Neolewinella xylanilytica]PPK88175.1 putative secreted protein (Por secretion system target) [Neolewinella xylanilytica]